MAMTVKPEAKGDVSFVKAFINCSEPCQAETFGNFLEAFAGWGVRPDQLQTCYAMAETVFAVTQTPLHEPVTPLEVDAESLQTRGRALPKNRGTSFLSVGKPDSGDSRSSHR